ncbi:D-Ala-D-Ala carboxypeptidase family metallohydrolase [Tenacibaculum mesophilum]|uniref:D-Ala-D-Ala carboxypeptidase family metallohydrolase n=1 Tax=Tenacibaculum mesophilum TaxID=104268 RepID=UPI00069E8397|nr:D-Ala-D-Ala carboxypeptidase family metallohydrolase [Tenacibaculum mesophilum]
MSQFYKPYREKYGKHVVKHYIHLKPPLDGFADGKTLSTNLTLGEIRKSSYIMPDEKNLFAYVPLDSRVVQAFQILRDALGKPIVVTSSFRSVRYELSRKPPRSGKSQHTYGTALDLKGSGLVELVQDALATKNKLYQRLRAVGVNGFGVYVEKNFIHIDVRDAKPDGGYAYWEGSEEKELKKKDSSTSTILKPILTILGFVTTAVGLYSAIKKRKK